MKFFGSPASTRLYKCFAAALIAVSIGACGSLRQAAGPPTVFYSLDDGQSNPVAAARTAAALFASSIRPDAMPTLIVNPPHAAAGFDSGRIIYVREAQKLEYFAHSEWVDPPARMLAPLLVGALEKSGAFRAVALTPSAAAGDLRLDTEIIRLQQEFDAAPSRVRFTLRAYLVDDKTRRMLASREFNASVPAASDDPHGGVVAANRAVQVVLAQLAEYCAEQSRQVRMEK